MLVNQLWFNEIIYYIYFWSLTVVFKKKIQGKTIHNNLQLQTVCRCKYLQSHDLLELFLEWVLMVEPN